MADVILISGSPRAEGNTVQVLREAARILGDAGLAAEMVSLSGKDIRSCVACRGCVSLGRCLMEDGFNEILELVRPAKGLIVGAPVYFGTARADLMALLQRLGMVSKATDGFLSWKVGGPVAVGRRGGHTASIQEMLMFYLINDMIVPGANYWNMLFGRHEGEVQTDSEGIENIRRFASNVATLVQKLAD